MRRFLFINILLFICFLSHAQNISTPQDTTFVENMGGTGPSSSDVDMVFTFAEVMPAFPGGDKAFDEYIKSKLTYPKDAKDRKIEGMVFVQFIIETDGSVTNVSVVPGRGLYPSLDQTAIDIIKSSPKWTPGSQNGRIVRVKKVKRITFVLTK